MYVHTCKVVMWCIAQWQFETHGTIQFENSIITWYSLEVFLICSQPVHLQPDIGVNDLSLSTAWLGQGLSTDDGDGVMFGSHSWDVIMTLGVKHTILCRGNTATQRKHWISLHCAWSTLFVCMCVNTINFKVWGHYILLSWAASAWLSHHPVALQASRRSQSYHSGGISLGWRPTPYNRFGSSEQLQERTIYVRKYVCTHIHNTHTHTLTYAHTPIWQPMFQRGTGL